MGLFKKVGLALSGLDGQVELNIRTAFNYLEEVTSKELLLEFHYNSQIPFLSFSWAIAAECYLSIYPEERHSSGTSKDGKRLALLTKKTLEDMGYPITIDIFTTPLEEDLYLSECGVDYMRGVLKKNRVVYMQAIKDAAQIIRNQ